MTTHYHKTMEVVGPVLRDMRKLYDRAHINASVGRVLGYVQAYTSNYRGVVDPENVEFKRVSTSLGASAFYLLMGEALRTTGSFFSVLAYNQLPLKDNPIALFLLALKEDLRSPQVQFNLVRTFHLLAFEQAGKKVYEVSDGLADQLVHTELRGVDTDDLRLPFESIYLILPKSIRFRVFNDNTGWHEVEAVYIIDDPCLAGMASGFGSGHRGWRIMIVGSPKNERDPLDDALFYFPVPLPKGAKVNEALEELQREIPEARLGGTEMIAEIDKLFRFLMNTVLYATSQDVESERTIPNKEARQLVDRLKKAEGKKRERIKERLRGLDSQEVIILGRSVRRFSRGDGEGPELIIRTKVAGHFQHYWRGKGKAERIRRWRQPFWRGPLDAPISNPKHRLEESHVEDRQDVIEDTSESSTVERDVEVRADVPPPLEERIDAE